MKFILEIELDDEAMHAADDVRLALDSVKSALAIYDGGLFPTGSHVILDRDGKVAGEWEIAE